MLYAIETNCTWDPDKILLQRSAWLKKWTTSAMEVTELEKDLHSKLPKHRKGILPGKRFLVFREMVREMAYPDPGIVDAMISGLDLVGEAGGGHMLLPDYQPATLSIADFEDQSNRSNKAIMHSTKSCGSELVDAELWEKTVEEKKGWLLKLDRLPQDVPSEKVRLIDNYRERERKREREREGEREREPDQQCRAVTVANKCTVLDGVDTIAAMMAAYSG
jgi:hypothetical protein